MERLGHCGGATPEELIEQWLDPATATIMKPGLHGAGLLRPKVLHEKARELFARFRPRLPFGLTLAEIPRLRPHLIRDSAITWQHLAATCSIPFGFPPVAIDGRKFVDGGLLGALPLWAAGEMGATRAIALNVLNRLPFTLLRTVLRPPLPGSRAGSDASRAIGHTWLLEVGGVLVARQHRTVDRVG